MGDSEHYMMRCRELNSELTEAKARIAELEERERRARCACDQYGRQFVLSGTIGVILFDIKSELYGDPLEHIQDANSISILQARIDAAVGILQRNSWGPYSIDSVVKALTGETGGDK